MATSQRWKPSRMGVTQILNLLRLAGETAWLYPWSLAVGVWLGGAPRPPLEPVALLAVLVLAAAGTQGTMRTRQHPRLARGAFIGLGALVACLVALGQMPFHWVGNGSSEVWGLLSREGYGGRAATGAATTVFLWWRGITVGRSRPDSGNIEDEFRTGILAMAGLLVVAVLTGGSARASSSGLLISVIVLVFSGLVGMPLARVVDESERPRHSEPSRISPGGPWLTMLLMVVGAILLATLILAQIFTFQRLSLLFEPLRGPLDAVLWALFYVVVMPVGLLLEVLVFLIRLVVKPGEAPPPIQAPTTDWLNQFRQQEGTSPMAAELLLVLKVALAILLGLLLVVFLLRAVRRFSDWWREDDVEEVRGFLASRPGPRDLLRWLLRKLRPMQAHALEGREGEAVTAGAGAGIRDLYRQFLVLGGAMGHRRRPPETPREYQARLGEEESLLGADEVDVITESYNRARYAPAASSPPDVAPMASALARLRTLWHDRSRSWRG